MDPFLRTQRARWWGKRVAGGEVTAEFGRRIQFRVSSRGDDDLVAFEELVGFVAREEEAKGGVREFHRRAADHLLPVSQGDNVWPREFTKA
jgi:hypothetical protein